MIMFKIVASLSFLYKSNIIFLRIMCHVEQVSVGMLIKYCKNHHQLNPKRVVHYLSSADRIKTINIL